MASIREQVRESVRKEGFFKTGKYAVRYAIELGRDALADWRLGIRSTGRLSVERLGLSAPFAEKYAPTDYASVAPVLDYLDIQADQHEVFLDYGSGKGRMLILAAQKPFRRVIGIELSEELNTIAERNIANTRAGLVCQEVQVFLAEAGAFVVPDDVTVAYFYSPFTGDILRSVLDNLEASLRAAPRRLRLVFKDPDDFENEVGDYPWLTRVREFAAPHQHSRLRYVLYEGRLDDEGHAG